MPAIQSPFLGVNYGWSLGEDNWNIGMDENLLKISALLYGTVDGIVTATPGMNSGQIFYNTTNNSLDYNVNGASYSVSVPIGYTFGDKVTGKTHTLTPSGLVEAYNQASADLRYILQSSAGSFGLTLLATATAAAARSAMGLGSASTQPSAAFEAAITAGTTSQYWRGDKSFVDFATDVRSSVLSGLVTSSSTVITASDSVLSAMGKLQAQVSLKAPLDSPTLTGSPTAPTPATGDISTKIATTEFVSNAMTQSGSLAMTQAIVLSFL